MAEQLQLPYPARPAGVPAAGRRGATTRIPRQTPAHRPATRSGGLRHLDARTREAGQRGVAEARRALAAGGTGHAA